MPLPLPDPQLPGNPADALQSIQRNFEALALADLRPTYQTTLPDTAVEGQEIYYQDTGQMATDGIIWHLRYRSAARSGSGAWEFLGGPSLNDGPKGSRSTTSTTAVDLTSGPTVGIPENGKYEVQFGIRIRMNDASGISAAQYILRQTTATAFDVVSGAISLIDNLERQEPSRFTTASLDDGDSLAIQIKNSVARTIEYDQAWIVVRPVYLY